MNLKNIYERSLNLYEMGSNFCKKNSKEIVIVLALTGSLSFAHHTNKLAQNNFDKAKTHYTLSVEKLISLENKLETFNGLEIARNPKVSVDYAKLANEYLLLHTEEVNEDRRKYLDFKDAGNEDKKWLYGFLMLGGGLSTILSIIALKGIIYRNRKKKIKNHKLQTA